MEELIYKYKKWARLGLFSSGPNPIFIPKKRSKKKAVRRKKGNKKGFVRLSKKGPPIWSGLATYNYRVNLNTGVVYWEEPQKIGRWMREAVKK